MKTKISSLTLGLFTTAVIIFTACNKDESIASSTETSTDADIAVAASDTTIGKDSVYIVHDCSGGSTRDSIAESELPSEAATYLEDNYSEYTFAKAFSVSDSTGSITGYVAVIYYEDNPVGIEFDSEGAFIRVLDQRGDRSHHRGRKG